MAPYHSLLRRQLKRIRGDAPPPEDWRPFLQAVDEAYKQGDADRLMLERSLDLSSEELLQANREMRAVIDLLPDLFFRLNADGVILDCNTHTPALLTRPAGELVGRRIQEAYPGRVGERYRQALEHLRRTGERALMEYELGEPGFTRFYTASLLPMPSGQVIVFIHEITNRKRAEADLRKSEIFNRNLVEHLPLRIFIKDRDLVYLAVNSVFARDLGLAPAQIVGKSDFDLFPRDMAERFRALDKAVLATGALQETEEPYLPEGKELWAHTVKVPYCDEQGRVIGVMGMYQDITDRKQAEADLRRERDRAQGYLDTVEAIIVALDAKGRVTLINRKGCRMLGYEEKDVLGRSWFATCLPQPDGMEKVYPFFCRLMAGEISAAEYFENPVVSRTGEQRQIAWHNALLHDDQGQIIGTLSAGEDITERVRAESERRRLAAAVEQTHESVVILDMESRIQYVNPAFEHITGVGRQELLGKNPESLQLGEPLLRLFQDIREAAPKGQAWSGRVSHRHHSGRRLELNATVSPMREEDGRVVSIVIVLHDMTREIELEK